MSLVSRLSGSCLVWSNVHNAVYSSMFKTSTYLNQKPILTDSNWFWISAEEALLHISTLYITSYLKDLYNTCRTSQDLSSSSASVPCSPTCSYSCYQPDGFELSSLLWDCSNKFKTSSYVHLVLEAFVSTPSVVLDHNLLFNFSVAHACMFLLCEEMLVTKETHLGSSSVRQTSSP